MPVSQLHCVELIDPNMGAKIGTVLTAGRAGIRNTGRIRHPDKAMERSGRRRNINQRGFTQGGLHLAAQTFQRVGIPFDDSLGEICQELCMRDIPVIGDAAGDPGQIEISLLVY